MQTHTHKKKHESVLAHHLDQDHVVYNMPHRMHPTSPDRAAKANGVQPRVGIWHPRSLRSKDAIQPCDRLNAQLRHGHVTMGMAPNKEAPSTPHDRWGPWIRWPSLTCTTGMNPSTAPVVDLSLIFLPLMACPAIKKQRASMHESWDTQKARQGKAKARARGKRSRVVPGDTVGVGAADW